MELAIIPQQFETALAKIEASADDSRTLAAAFGPHFAAFQDAATSAAAIQPSQPAAARASRLALKDIRVASEKTRKGLKEDVLRRGKAIDGYHAILCDALVPVEQALDEIEKAEARAEAKRKADLHATRLAELSAYCDAQHFALGDMSEAAYQGLLAGQIAAKKAADEAAEAARLKAIADAEAAEAARVAAEAAAVAERERLQAEAAAAAEALRVERAAQAERDRVAAEALAAERAAAAEAMRVQEAAAQAERGRLAKREAEAAEAARQERLRLQAIAEVQRQEREQIERKAQAEREVAAAEIAKAKAEADRLAAIEAARVAAETAKREAEAEARRKAERAPDADKLRALAAIVRALPVPEMATAAGASLASKIGPEFSALADRIDAAADRL